MGSTPMSLRPARLLAAVHGTDLAGLIAAHRVRKQSQVACRLLHMCYPSCLSPDCTLQFQSASEADGGFKNLPRPTLALRS